MSPPRSPTSRRSWPGSWPSVSRSTGRPATSALSRHRRSDLAWPGEVGPMGRDIDTESRIDLANDVLKAHRSLQRRMAQAGELIYQDVLKRDPDNRLALVDMALVTRQPAGAGARAPDVPPRAEAVRVRGRGVSRDGPPGARPPRRPATGHVAVPARLGARPDERGGAVRRRMRSGASGREGEGDRLSEAFGRRGFSRFQTHAARHRHRLVARRSAVRRDRPAGQSPGGPPGPYGGIDATTGMSTEPPTGQDGPKQP